VVYEASGCEAYDWIVAGAGAQHTRQMNEPAWERTIDEVDPAAAFELVVAA
jgi:hypothetical protein